ncbi:MAG: hypothetical protein ABI333_16630, partial [bacterium]
LEEVCPMRRWIQRVWFVATLVAAGGISLVGCGKPQSGAKKSKAGRSASAPGMGGGSGGGGGAMSAPDPRPAARPAPPAAPGSKAGFSTWFYKWDKAVSKLNIRARKHQKDKELAEALKLLDEALGLQPGNLDLRYKRAYVRALHGDAKGALADAGVLLLANYPKYAYKIAVDKDFASLRKPPHQAALEALHAEAQKEHLAAWKQAVFFLGANKRAYKVGTQIRGGQEVWGYVPETGRFVAVTFVGDGNVLGFLVSPDRQSLVYAAASRYLKEYPSAAFYDPQVQVLSLATGKRLKTYTVDYNQSNTPLGVVKAAGAASEGPENAQTHGVKEIRMQLRSGGLYEVWLVRDDSAGKDPNAAKGGWQRFRVDKGAVQEAGEGGGGKPSKVVDWVHIRQCGAKGKRIDWARQLKQAGGTFELGGKKVTFKCAGLLWPSRDRARGVFQPFGYCEKSKDAMVGLYLVDAAGVFKQIHNERGAWNLRWITADRALVAFGPTVGFIDAKAGTFKRFTTPEGFLKTYGPNAEPCLPAKVD